MKMKFLLALGVIFAISASAFAEEKIMTADEETGIEELNPFAPGVEDLLRGFDVIYEKETGLSAFPDGEQIPMTLTGCYRENCAVFVDVDKSSQTLRLYLNGRAVDQWPVSTGMAGHGTPDFDQRFNGRIYDKFSSNTYPGGDYRGLGNMPYAMFISGGFAVHGTPEANWSRLGRPASHGCIRVHPDHARYLNRQLRQVGVRNSWVTVH